jgi:hypothetical protein
MNLRVTRGTGQLAIAIVLLTSGVALAQDVKYNYAPGTDFSKYHTYKWVSVEGATHPDQLVDAQIRQAIDGQLAKKGFTKTTTDSADLAVAYQVAVDQEKQWNAIGGGVGFRLGGGMASATSSTISIGTLVFDVYDGSAKQLLWRGDATKTISPSNDPQKNQEHLEKSAEKLLKNFPPVEKK